MFFSPHFQTPPLKGLQSLRSRRPQVVPYGSIISRFAARDADADPGGAIDVEDISRWTFEGVYINYKGPVSIANSQFTRRSLGPL